MLKKDSTCSIHTYSTTFTMEVAKKMCNQCGEAKPLSEFPVDKSLKDNHRGICKVCYNSSRTVVRRTNTKKEDEISVSLSQFPTEYQSFAKHAINLLQKIDRIDDSDVEFLDNFGEKCQNFSQEIKYPPTNTFTICESTMKDCRTTEINISAIHS